MPLPPRCTLIIGLELGEYLNTSSKAESFFVNSNVSTTCFLQEKKQTIVKIKRECFITLFEIKKKPFRSI